MRWNEISALTFSTALSSGQFQPLPPDQWPTWAQGSTKFSGAWGTVVGGPLAPSTAGLSTSSGEAYVDLERTGTRAPHLRYYRFAYVQMADGRVFESTPLKNLEYERHRNERPTFLTARSTEASS